MKSSKILSCLFLFLILLISSCSNKSLNSRLDKIEVGETASLEKIINCHYPYVMIVSNANREKTIADNCNKIKFKQPYENWDFVLLCKDEKNDGFVYVINPFFGYLDSINIFSTLRENYFFDFDKVYIRRINKRKFEFVDSDELIMKD